MQTLKSFQDMPRLVLIEAGHRDYTINRNGNGQGHLHPLRFTDLRQAVLFCQRMNWRYRVDGVKEL